MATSNHHKPKSCKSWQPSNYRLNIHRLFPSCDLSSETPSGSSDAPAQSSERAREADPGDTRGPHMNSHLNAHWRPVKTPDSQLPQVISGSFLWRLRQLCPGSVSHPPIGGFHARFGATQLQGDAAQHGEPQQCCDLAQNLIWSGRHATAWGLLGIGESAV